MRADGATYVQIKATLGVGTSTVSRMLGAAGAGKPRPRISAEVREKARALREDGMTVPDIASSLGISRSTAYLITKDIEWVRTEESAARAKNAARRRWDAYEARRKSWLSQLEDEAADFVGELTSRELMLIGAALYWAEGSKSKPWRRSEKIAFVNSDPTMIRVFLAWLRLMGVAPDRIIFRVMIHESADVAAAEAYWAGIVGVPSGAFARVTLKRHNPLTVRKNTGDGYHGCLVVRVRRSVAEYRQVEALWAALAAATRIPGNGRT